MADVTRRLLVLVLVLCSVSAAGQDGQIQALPDFVFITGRVVDEAGQPVKGVAISAITSAMGRTLRSAHTHGNGTGDGDFMAISRRDGSFLIPVPFAQIRYTLGLHLAMGYEMSPHSVIAEEGAEPVELVVKPIEAMAPIYVSVKDPDGLPVASEPVTLVGEYGGQWVALTDEAGLVVFDDVRAQHLGQATLVIGRGELVAPLTIVHWRDQKTTEVTLAKPATMRGRVVDSETGAPIADATVLISPGFVSGLDWQVTTDDDGRYELIGLPPGEYNYRAVCPTHADHPPRGHYWHERTVELKAGESTDASAFDMRPRATLRGRVVGPDGKPVVGAMVGYPCHFGQHYDNTDAVFTDEQGRFELRPANINQSDRQLEAFHPLAGGARQRLDSFEDGQMVEGVELVTAGTARLRGTVTDEAGQPIAAVPCVYSGPGSVRVSTDAQGAYDMGRLQLYVLRKDPPKLNVVKVLPPRPSLGGHIQREGENWQQAQIEPGDRTFYMAHSALPKLGPDGDAQMDFTLRQTQLLTFRGVASDDQGNPIQNARVYLLPRKITAEDEAHQQTMERFVATRDVVHRWMSTGVIGGSERAFSLKPDELRELVVTTTDHNGAWAMQCLQSDTDARFIMLMNHCQAEQEDDAPRASGLQWVTVLVVMGEKGERHLLYEPTRIVADQSHYVVPLGEEGEDE